MLLKPHNDATSLIFLEDLADRPYGIRCFRLLDPNKNDIVIFSYLKDLEEKGLRFDPASTEWDENGKKIVYLDHELAGFALHLVRKELK